MAITNTVSVNLEMDSPNNLVLIHAVQGEYYSRQVTANLYNNGSRYTIPNEAIALIRYRKPDASIGFYDFDAAGNRIVTIPSAGTYANKQVIFTIAPEMCDIPGRVFAHIDLYSKTSGNRLSAFYFELEVERAATDPEIMREADVGGVTDLVREIIGSVYTPSQTPQEGAIIDNTLSIPGAVGDAKAMGDVVLVQDDEPDTEEQPTNKLWIDSDSLEEGIEVPDMADIVSDFDSTKTYSYGDYANHEGHIYKYIDDTASSGSWDGSKWESAIVCDEIANNSTEVSELKSAIDSNIYEPPIEINPVTYITRAGDFSGTGSFFASTYYICSSTGYAHVDGARKLVAQAPSGYAIKVLEYTANPTTLQAIHGDAHSELASGTNRVEFNWSGERYFRFVIGRFNNGDSSDYINSTFLGGVSITLYASRIDTLDAEATALDGRVTALESGEPYLSAVDLYQLISVSRQGAHQGACTDGITIYSAVPEYHKFVKFDILTRTATRPSYSADLGHCNDMTYNPNTGYVYIAKFDDDNNGVAVFDPVTMSLIETKILLDGNGDPLNFYAICWDNVNEKYYVYTDRAIGKNIAIYDSMFNYVGALTLNHSWTAGAVTLETDGTRLFLLHHIRSTPGYLGVFDLTTGNQLAYLPIDHYAEEIESMMIDWNSGLFYCGYISGGFYAMNFAKYMKLNAQAQFAKIAAS